MSFMIYTKIYDTSFVNDIKYQITLDCLKVFFGYKIFCLLIEN